jgi:alpha-amylase
VRILDAQGNELGDFVNGEWLGDESAQASISGLWRDTGDVAVSKTITADGARTNGSLSVQVTVHSKTDLRGTVELEWNLNLLGGGGNPEAYYRWGDQELRHDMPGRVDRGARLSFGNTYEGVVISVATEPTAEQAWVPLETVSNSEAGFERVYQGSCLTQRWPIDLHAGEQKTFRVILSFEQTRDRAAEEAS